MKQLKLIIEREYLARVRTKAFVWTTLLVPVALVLMTVLPSVLLSLGDSDIKKIAVVDNSGLYGGVFSSSDDYQFQYISTNRVSAKGGMDALLEINADLSQNPSAVVLYSEKQKPPRELVAYIKTALIEAVRTQQVDQFTETNDVQPTVVADLKQLLADKPAIKINTLRWIEDGKSISTLDDSTFAVSMLLVFVMLLFIMMYGSIVMQSTVEEKTNRIVEVIVSSVKPFYLMLGKIISVALTGITQIAIWTGLGIITMLVVGLSFMDSGATLSSPESQQVLTQMSDPTPLTTAITNLGQINWLQVTTCFLLYFIGGYLLFASLFAMFGAAANDSQEAQQFMMPMNLLLLTAFYVGFASGTDPDGSMAFWTSLIPFTSPIVMMARIPFEIPLWELLVSLLLLYSTAVLMIYIASKIYRVGILTHGKKASFRDIFKWIKYQ